jgi:hypothetical protein
LLGESGIDEILTHPWLQLNVVTARCKGWAGSEQPLLQKAGLLGAVFANLAGRRALGAFFERGILHSPAAPPVALQADGFHTHSTALSRDTLLPALMATASIPMVMSPVRDIPGLPVGAYLDGGMIDCHMDLPLHLGTDLPQSEAKGLLFLPHFGEKITTGWLDKFLPWRKPLYGSHTLLIAPSRDFLATLPQGRIPDRHDFYRYAGRDDERIRDWNACVAAGQQLADEWMELVTSGRVASRIESL